MTCEHMIYSKGQFPGVQLYQHLTFGVGGICVDRACAMWLHALGSE